MSVTVSLAEAAFQQVTSLLCVFWRPCNPGFRNFFIWNLYTQKNFSVTFSNNQMLLSDVKK